MTKKKKNKKIRLKKPKSFLKTKKGKKIKKVFKKNKIIEEPKSTPSSLDEATIHQTKIRVIGIGGGGGSIISEIASDVKRVDFVAANTDNKSLNELMKKVKRFQFGQNFTGGLGTGMNDELGEMAALNEKERIKKFLEGQDLCIIVACLGGGTSSGAAHVFAKISKNLGNLTYGIFTLPFEFEGEKKMEIANRALEKIKPNLNAYSIIPNERIFQIIDKNTPLKNALSAINKKLAENLEGLIEMIYLPGLINIDFSDLKTVLQGQGRLAYLNTIEIEVSPNREEAIKKIIYSPLYPYTVNGARGILYNINGGKNLQLSEVSYISKIISESVNKQSKTIFGINQNPKYQDKIKITLLATGCVAKDFLSKPKQNTNSIIPEIKKIRKKIMHQFKKEETTQKNKPLEKKEIKNKKVKKIKKEDEKPKELKEQKKEIKSFQPIKPLEKKPEIEKIEIKVRRNGLQLKKAAEEEENELLKQEKELETPAIFRKNNK